LQKTVKKVKGVEGRATAISLPSTPFTFFAKNWKKSEGRRRKSDGHVSSFDALHFFAVFLQKSEGRRRKNDGHRSSFDALHFFYKKTVKKVKGVEGREMAITLPSTPFTFLQKNCKKSEGRRRKSDGHRSSFDALHFFCKKLQ